MVKYKASIKPGIKQEVKNEYTRRRENVSDEHNGMYETRVKELLRPKLQEKLEELKKDPDALKASEVNKNNNGNKNNIFSAIDFNLPLEKLDS